MNSIVLYYFCLKLDGHFFYFNNADGNTEQRAQQSDSSIAPSGASIKMEAGQVPLKPSAGY
jgi:hypothetical protein